MWKESQYKGYKFKRDGDSVYFPKMQPPNDYGFKFDGVMMSFDDAKEIIDNLRSK